MNAIERMKAVFAGKLPDRVPFVPTIFEHAGVLLGHTPSALAQNAALIVEAQECAFEHYGHDLVTVGVDIYNVEAEALGCEVRYYDSEDIPGIVRGILIERAMVNDLRLPDPRKIGRLPLMLEVGKSLKARIGRHVLIGGSVVGPFTLAAILRGIDRFMMDLIDDLDFCQQLLALTCEMGVIYGEAWIAQGLGLSINESFCTKPFISEPLYARLVFPFHQKMIAAFRAKGMQNIGLIIGGDTFAFSQYLVRTGTSILIADYNTNLAQYKTIATQAGVVLRGNVNPTLLAQRTEEELLEAGKQLLRQGMPGGRFLLGTGVVPYQSHPERLLALKELTQTIGVYHE